MQDKHWKAAQALFSSALAVEPEDAKTRFLLAKVDYESGQIEAARTELEKALLLRPNQKEFLELRDKLNAAPPSKAGNR
jgi:predicted TPR repeat methyltransferase